MSVETVKVARRGDKDFGWHRQSANGKIVAASSEGYENFADALENAKHINGDVGETHDGTTLQYILERP